MLLACSRPTETVETIMPPRPTDSTLPLVTEAAKTQAQAARIAKQKDLSNAELIQMLRLSEDLKRSVRTLRAHRTATNRTAVWGAIRALRRVVRK